MKINIICTLGPVSESKDSILSLANAGMTVARLNFSHGTYKDHQKMINNIREINKEKDLNIKIMGDLCGPKIRTQNKLPISILKNEEIILGKDLKISHPEIIGDLKINEKILIDDGKIVFKVKSLNPIKIAAEESCTIHPHKGINLPNTKLKIKTTTNKDLKDLEFALKNNLEIIAQSFVRKASDIKYLKEICKNNNLKICAKIETPEAIKNIKEITKESDLIMIARGDLAVELPFYELYKNENTIIKECNKQKKHFIVATQMLNNMMYSNTPSRAEIIDISYSITNGANGLLLSNETSVSENYIKSTAVLKKLIEKVK